MACSWLVCARMTPNSSPPSRPTMSLDRTLSQQHLGDMAQRRVAGRMAVLVVDLLHAVDVEIDDARRHAIALGEGDHPRQLAHKGAPVGDRRQRVLVGQPLERGDLGSRRPPVRAASRRARPAAASARRGLRRSARRRACRRVERRAWRGARAARRRLPTCVAPVALRQLPLAPPTAHSTTAATRLSTSDRSPSSISEVDSPAKIRARRPQPPPPAALCGGADTL